jgi:hypothetical protein
MASASVVTELECLRCHAVYDDQRLFTGCPRCAQQSVNVNLTVRVPAATGGRLTPEGFPAAPRSLWRFVDAVSLPIGIAIARRISDRIVNPPDESKE